MSEPNIDRPRINDLPLLDGVAVSTSSYEPIVEQPHRSDARRSHRAQPAAAHHLLRAAGRTVQPAGADWDDFDESSGDTPTLNLPLEPAADAEKLSPEEWDSVDWGVVEELIEEHGRATDRAGGNADGGDHIHQIVRERMEADVRERGGNATWNPRYQRAMEAALHASIYGVGRLQPLLDDDRIENIHINGTDDVIVQFNDGRRELRPPVVSVNSGVVDIVSRVLEQATVGGRSWTHASPDLDLELPGGARLAAIMEPAVRMPSIVIRIHRLVDVDLDELVERESLSEEAAEFLTAAVRANQSIVIAGEPAAGKTTMLRALANCIDDPLEPIATIEMDRELHLDRMPERHRLVYPFQYHPGGTEYDAHGRRRGEYTLEQAIRKSLRLNLQRIIVGEVRGGEVNAMFQAMQAGAGSFSTLHAESAHDAISRLVTLSMESNPAGETYAERLIAQHIKFSIHATRVQMPDGKLRRVISEIAQVVRDDNGRPSTLTIYEYDPNAETQVQRERPTDAVLARLARAGLNVDRYFPRPAGGGDY